MANLEKVDVVIVGAGASGSLYASVLSKAGKKVVLLEAGPDWQLSDLISSDIWGRRIKPSGVPFLFEGKNPYGYGYQGGWGVGGAALHYFANFPRYLPTDFKVKSEYGKGLDWPITYADIAPFYDKVAAEIGVSGDAKAEEIWRPRASLSDAADEDVPQRPGLAQGPRVQRHPHGAGRRRHELDRLQGPAACIYDGWCHVGCPIGALANPLVTYLATRERRRRGARAFDRDARAHRRRRRQGDGRRILRRQQRKAGAGGERRHPRRLGGAEPAPASEFVDRQAPEGARQFKRSAGQLHDGALRLRHMGDVR